VFNEMLDDEETLESQYDVLAGRWPKKYNEMILVLSDPNEITDLMIYGLGLRDDDELKDMIAKVNANEKVETSEPKNYTYEDLLSISYKLIDPSDTYLYNEKYKIYEDMTDNKDYMEKVYNDGIDLKIVGIVCAKDDTVSTSLTTGIAYKKELTEYVIKKAEKSEIVQKQLKNPEIDIFSNKRFDEDNKQAGLDFQDMISIDTDMLSSAFGISVSESDITSMTKGYMETISQAITADTSQAENDFLNDLSTLTNGLLKDYLKNHSDSLTNGAILKSSEVEKIVNDYLAKEESQKILKNLEEKYTIPQDTFQTVYQNIITTFLQGYIQIAPINSDDPSSIITEALIDSMVEQLMNQKMIQDTSKQLSTKMVEAGMQKTILGTVGELSQSLIRTMANSFHVDESKISNAFSFDLNEEELMRLMQTMTSNNEEKNAAMNLRSLGYQNLDEPSSISFYFKDFESKENFLEFLDNYNQKMEKEDEDKVINYTDLTGILTSSVKLIVDSVSYVLIAFVSISLIVSSIMIGIITYISVLERTKEIGILRAIGASKRNISSIFNAETFIVGLCAGFIGIGITLLLIPPINHVIHTVTGNTAINATLPLNAALILIALSIVLTLISGLIPSRQASQKDPVTALRSE
ncbi:MAG: ABC transporter permease, partial [Faecalibacillus sp.]